MNSEKENEIKRLSFENFIWIIFIVVSALDIYGDELVKKYIRENDKKADIRAKKIFFYVLIVTIIIYMYFFIRNYHDVQNHPGNDEYEIRLLGSVFMLAGTICLLYFQIETTTITEGPSNV